MEKIKKDVVVLDTSVIIEGIITELLKERKLETKKIIIPEVVMAELEAQANKGKESGFVGLEEINAMKEICKENSIELSFYGKKPDEESIKYAKVGAIDSIIRDVAEKFGACLITGDRIQALIAKIKNIDVLFFEVKAKKLSIEKFFAEDTMSLHLREGLEIMAKKGKPGNWQLVSVGKKLSREEIKAIEKEIIEVAKQREDGFIEIDRKFSTIVQIGTYRISITRPPFSKYYELTIASPIKQLEIEDYFLNDKLMKRIERAEGILVAGPPGHGKSTFVQALAKFYLRKNKIIKTIEAPRDLVLPREITQYALAHSSHDEIRDILLLSRPDFTIFDEMRNTSDFHLYADLRLAGIGLIGVIHATEPIDAIQRFFGRVELGTLPSIVDTVIFIRDGEIKKVLSLSMEVKVPFGMVSLDLARPVIVVRDYLTNKPEYEIYSYAEQIVVNRIEEKFEEKLKLIEKEVFRYIGIKPKMELQNGVCKVYLPRSKIPFLIGKKGKIIERIERKAGMKIEVSEIVFEEKANFDVKISKKNIRISLDRKAGIAVFFINDEFILRKEFEDGFIKIKRKSAIGKKIFDALKNKSLNIYYE